MKKYIDPENERYQYMVRETFNGFALQVLVVPQSTLAALTPQVAAQIGVRLPDAYRLQSCKEENAQKELDRVATLNGWMAIEQE